MLDDKDIRMLELLDDMILNCKKCDLYTGGHVIPYWTSLSKYAMIGEAPGRKEVENNEPFVGKTGRMLWDIMSEYGFRKEEFLIINSVQCRPTDGVRNLKPSIDQISLCKQLWKKYIKVVKPYRMILLGNFARGSIDNSYSGILRKNAQSHYSNKYDMYYLTSIHPSYCIYNKSGHDLLRESIKEFRYLGMEEG